MAYAWESAPLAQDDHSAQPAWMSAPLAQDEVMQTPAQAEAKEEPGLLKQVGRQLGLTVRHGIEGLGQAADVVTEAVAGPMRAVGIPTKSTSQLAAGAADWMGLPKPETAQERVVGDAARMVAGAGGFMGAGAGATKAGMTTLGKFFSANPAAQVVSAASSGAAGGVARESGAGATGQTLAALAGAMAPAGLQAAKKATQAVTKHSLGMTTGAGSDAIGEAYKAGKQGNQAFVDNMRGKVSAHDVVADAKAGLDKMRADRAAQYRSGMVDIKADKSVLDYAPIDKALGEVREMGNYKGVPIYQKAASTVGELDDLVKQWRSLPASEFHTPEGLDALKKAVGDIRTRTQPGTAERVAADKVYNAIKTEITKQAPTYSKVMKDYSEATDLIDEIGSTLSANRNASVDTSLRKLQSIMRNNANTNYGHRQGLVKKLEQQGGVDLVPALAGQALNSWTPRGLQQIPTTFGAGALAVTNPELLPAMALTSPRLMGETAYRLGDLARRVPKGPQGLGRAGVQMVPLSVLATKRE
ncbi:MAG: hypothetical protein ACI4QS_10755 [Comamonas sp.]